MAKGFVPSDLFDDLLCCVICYEPFNETRVPKALPCLHTFCRDCLQNTIHAHRRSHYRQSGQSTGHFPCPLCNDLVRIPANGLDGFRNDFRIRRMSELMRRNRDGDGAEPGGDPVGEAKEGGGGGAAAREAGVPELSVDGKSCEVCRFFNRESVAPVYCLECCKLLCLSCSEKHLKMPIASGHNIISSAEALPSNTTCGMHAGEQLKYFCRSCSKPICMTCTLTADHEGHDITTLAEASEAVKTSLNTLISTCLEKIPQIRSRVASFEQVEKRLTQKEQLAQRAVLSGTFEEITRAKNNQMKMEADLGAICGRKHKELKARRESMEEDIGNLQDLCDFTQTILERGQDIQVVGTRAEVADKLTKMAATALPSAPDVATFTNLAKYDALAEEQQSEEDDGNPPITQSSILAEIKSVVVQMRLFSQGRLDLKVEPLKTIGRRGSRDGEFNFPSAVAVLPNGDIAVADMHNNRVQIFDANGNFKRKFGHEGFKPCGIAVTRSGDIAVTDCKTHVNCIKVFTKNGEKKQQLGAGLFDYPFSLAIDSKGRYVVSDPAVSKITVVNTDGSVKSKFSTKSKFTFYLTVNSRDEILVSDWYHHHVKVFNQSGGLLRTIGGGSGSGGGGGGGGPEDRQLMIPLGLVCDSRDNVIVLDCKSEQVTMFTSDGKFVRSLIGKDEGIEHSRAMALSKEGHLVITHGDNKRDIPNEIRVYQI